MGEILGVLGSAVMVVSLLMCHMKQTKLRETRELVFPEAADSNLRMEL